jgi:predicted regulator of Ras-like GTPase activity (Roadblock/LC7/MglB family)
MEEYEVAVKYVSESLEGISFVGFIGRDGLPVTIAAKSEMDSAEASAELASIFNVVLRGTKALNIGIPTELFFTTASMGMIVYPVSEEYFLAVALSAPVNLGRARLEIKKILPKLEELIK